MNRSFAIAAPFFLCLLASCGAHRPQVSEPVRITLFHTNDTHASFQASKATWRDDQALVGGFEALEYHLRNQKDTAAHSLWLDAGDFMTGNPISNVAYQGVKGGALVELFNEIGLDAMALGNHEFDHPRENTLALVRLARFPILAANLKGPDGELFTGKDYVIKEVGGIRVGIIGFTPDDLGGLIGSTVMEGLSVTPAVEVLRELVPLVDEKSDLLVLLTHEGVEKDREIAQQIEGIDIIIGGHSHTRLARGEWVNDVLIAQAGANLQNLGRIDLIVENDRAIDVKASLVPLWAADAVASEHVSDLVGRFGGDIEEEYGEVIATSTAKLGRDYYAESPLGDWLTDRVRAITGADVAFLNSGGIRKDLQPGEVTLLTIQEMLPFSNSLCTFECTGEDLIAILESNLAAGALEEHGILQSSGLQVLWGRSGEDVWVVNATLTSRGGAKIDPTETYTIATVDFVARSQPEKYLGYRPAEIQGLGKVLSGAIMDDVRELGTIDPPEGRRMILQKQVDPNLTGTESSG